MRAKDIMQKRVVTVRPEMSLIELARLLKGHMITGVPVVDAKGRLVGVVSQTDLVRRKSKASAHSSGSFWDPDLAAQILGLETSTDYTLVREAMSKNVFTAGEETQIPDLLAQMVRERIHRVIITRDGELAGIVTTMDIMRGLQKWMDPYRRDLAEYVELP